MLDRYNLSDGDLRLRVAVFEPGHQPLIDSVLDTWMGGPGQTLLDVLGPVTARFIVTDIFYYL